MYDVMVTALRDAREARFAPVAVEPPSPALVKALGEPVVADHAAVPTLSPVVIDACAQYAYGDRMEQRANLGHAQAMAAQGYSDRDIVASIRDGAGTLPMWAIV